MELKDKLSQCLINSTSEVFSTALSMSPIIMARSGDVKSEDKKEIIAAIGLAGSLEGSLVVCTTNSSAASVVSKMLGCDVAAGSQDSFDGLGEVTNMLAGGFKTRISTEGHSFEISIPTVISGASPLHVCKPHKAEIIQLFVDCSEVNFDLYLFYTLKSSPSISGAGASKMSNPASKVDPKSSAVPASDNPEDLLKGLIG
ncbi:MAG TPA: chemotaxis protein CheX [Candidatus Omnitrophota bacterium]|nr:chemotaxis protein CheX [Candidatus Omnitrophota bacterium]HPS19770.1 chemotaxis protein CheX [Candidatus Omnitrophota bacterium]